MPGGGSLLSEIFPVSFPSSGIDGGDAQSGLLQHVQQNSHSVQGSKHGDIVLGGGAADLIAVAELTLGTQILGVDDIGDMSLTERIQYLIAAVSYLFQHMGADAVLLQEAGGALGGLYIEAQIIEGLVLNHINFQSLIATKTARVLLASQKGTIMEFGLRRAQGPDGAMSASRAAYIGGASSTSNTLAGKLYGIPVQGTMAHSWIMSFPTELEAFETYAQIYPNNSVFLIDTYDTLNSGIKNAIIVGKKLAAQGKKFGVRLDSGDIQYLSTEVRKALDSAGLHDATISVSNELDEHIIETLVQQKAPINSWGVGTHMVTGGEESSFTGVYKLAARKNPHQAGMIPAMKFSDNPEKTTNPGIKNVWRLYDADGMAKADILALEQETITENLEKRFFHPSVDYRQFVFTPAKVIPLLHKRIEKGNLIIPEIPPAEQLQKARKTLLSQLETFHGSYKRLLNPHIYKVSITEELKNLKLEFIKARIK